MLSTLDARALELLRRQKNGILEAVGARARSNFFSGWRPGGPRHGAGFRLKDAKSMLGVGVLDSFWRRFGVRFGNVSSSAALI